MSARPNTAPAAARTSSSRCGPDSDPAATTASSRAGRTGAGSASSRSNARTTTCTCVSPRPTANAANRCNRSTGRCHAAVFTKSLAEQALAADLLHAAQTGERCLASEGYDIEEHQLVDGSAVIDVDPATETDDAAALRVVHTQVRDWVDEAREAADLTSGPDSHAAVFIAGRADALREVLALLEER